MTSAYKLVDHAYDVVVVGVMGTMQALQAMLILLRQTDALKGKLLLFDGLNMQWQQVMVPKNPKCPVCSST